MIRVRLIAVIVLLVWSTLSCAHLSSSPGPSASNPSPETGLNTANRPAEWAIPVQGKQSLPNLFKISDALYRGAQPGDEGFARLKRMGIRTVVSLRTFHSDGDLCRKQGLDCMRIAMHAWRIEDRKVLEFLKIVTNPQRQPVFVHCRRGADRTGVMIAVYRVVRQGWSRDAAVEEMTKGGYGFRFFWQNLVDYVKDLDVQSIREKINGPPYKRMKKLEKGEQPLQEQGRTGALFS